MPRLHYSSDDQPGYSRHPHGRGFTYRDPDGKTVRDQAVRQRIEGIVIPPAWRQVWICLSPLGHLQATGRDDRGRKQYRYHPDWREQREQQKFDQLLAFAERLPMLRKAVDEDLRRHDLSKARVTAAAVRLLETSCIRVGNDAYRRANDTFGLTTLRDRHLNINGSSIEFDFVGKGGKSQHVSVNAPRVARVIRRCHELPGYQLWQWRDGQRKHRLSSTDINHYIRENGCSDCTAKTFRLWMGSVHALDYLIHQGDPTSTREVKKQYLAAVDVAREALRNTRAVCRKSYLHPAIERLHEQGKLKEVADYGTARGSKWLDREEVALKRVIAE